MRVQIRCLRFLAALLIFSCLVHRESFAATAGAIDYVPFDFPEIAASAQQPLVLGPAGETFKFVQTGRESCGKYLFAKLIVPAHVGPPPHIHHLTDEWFYAPQGGFSIFMGQHSYSDVTKIPGENAPKDTVNLVPMRPKELFYGPRFCIHGFMNTSNSPKELYLVWTPDTPDVSILNYFLTAGTVVKDVHIKEEPDTLSRIRLVSLAPKFGINQSADFWQYIKGVDESMPQDMSDDHRKELMELINSVKRGCK